MTVAFYVWVKDDINVQCDKPTVNWNMECIEYSTWNIVFKL